MYKDKFCWAKIGKWPQLVVIWKVWTKMLWYIFLDNYTTNLRRDKSLLPSLPFNF